MPRRRALACLSTSLLLAGCGEASQSRAAAPAWPFQRLEIGLMDDEGGAKALASSAPVKLRYHYLAGGINTSNPWTTWGRGDGRFVDDYVADSRAVGMVPVFTYYQLRQSLPGANIGDESEAIHRNLRDGATMRAYFEDLRVLFGRLGDVGGPVVVHVEPDLWGYVQQRHGDDAARTPAKVAETDVDGLAGLRNDVAGLAQGIKRLRDELAPNVILGYGLSIWGTGKDIAISNEPDGAVDDLAARAVQFYRSLGTRFDVVFGEFNDRTSAYAQLRGGAGDEAWWDSADFARHARFMKTVHQGTRRPLVMWQIPLGNTVMRSMDNTVRHYQDNRVQWLLSPAHQYRKLRTYRDAGVVALLFGPGQGDDTHAGDDARDGVTNPTPITGNRRRATVADDDGGYFKTRVRAYAKRGSLKLR
ncbi:MAG: hypothetical protein JHD16_11850 [Solirubrobacteraceae bacterium]|nr:hypothetical protein [Solirubrobacteraceae bacterium]